MFSIRYPFALILFFCCCVGPLPAHIRMGISVTSSYVGDREVAWRIKVAGEMLGWTVILDENKGMDIQNRTDLDWVISLLPHNEALNPHCPNYQLIFHPFNYLNRDRQLLPFYDRYDGFLLTINDRASLAQSLALRGKEFHFIPFYPTVFPVPYRQVPLDSLMTMVAVWGNRLKDEKFQTLYTLLSNTGYVKFYGTKKQDFITAESYLGPIPFDGVSVIEILQKHGIVLVMHSDIHLREQIPSSRIFEAAAASAVIISDANPFVIKHFGDSVFYINTKAPVEMIYAQINEILDTIYKDPEMALEKARKAHQIFTRKFEMTSQLLALEALNQIVLSKRVKQND